MITQDINISPSELDVYTLRVTVGRNVKVTVSTTGHVLIVNAEFDASHGSIVDKTGNSECNSECIYTEDEVSQEREKIVQIYCDGSSKGNPGPSAYAFRITGDGIVNEKAEKLQGIHTNNEAEYYAILRALEFVSGKRDEITVFVYSDSELVINQLNGTYRTKEPHLSRLKEGVLSLSREFKRCKFMHVPSESVEINDVHKMCERVQNT